MAISREEQLKILGRMKDSDIDDSDVEATDQEFWKGAAFHLPPAKIPVSLRLDEDVLVWYKKQTVSGYQTFWSIFITFSFTLTQLRQTLNWF